MGGASTEELRGIKVWQVWQEGDNEARGHLGVTSTSCYEPFLGAILND